MELLKIATVDGETRHRARELAKLIEEQGYVVAFEENDAYDNVFEVFLGTDKDKE